MEITRTEKLLTAIINGEQPGFEPYTRREIYLAAIAGADVNLPAPITREEILLYEIAKNGIGGGGAELNTCTVSFTGATEYITECVYMRYQDGNVERVRIDGPIETLDSVAAGTILVVRLGEGVLEGPFFDAVGDERVLAAGSATKGKIYALAFDESGSIEVMLG